MNRRAGRRQRQVRREPPVRDALAREQPRDPVVATPQRPATRQAQVGLAFGLLATVALPLAYQWTFRPGSRPPGVDGLIQIVELGGILAATAALLLGRRARAAGDRTTGAVWAPRLGGAAIVGYVMTVVVLLSRSA